MVAYSLVSSFVNSKVKLADLKIAVVPGKQFYLRYHTPKEVYDCILESNSPSLEILIYLPDKEKPIAVFGRDRSEKCMNLLNKLHELTA